MTLPWERQKHEPSKAFAAFKIYCDLGGDRSIAKVAEQGSYSQPTIAKWAREWNWRERSRVWDNHLRREERKQQIEAIREMNVRHVKAWMSVFVKGLQRLQTIDPDMLKPREVLDFLQSAIQGERLARGEPLLVTEERIPGLAEDTDVGEHDEKHAIQKDLEPYAEAIRAFLEHAQSPDEVIEHNGKAGSVNGHARGDAGTVGGG